VAIENIRAADVSCMTPYGPIETSRETTHDDPTYIRYGDCVGNLPGIAPVTASRALEAVSLPYAIKLADKGFDSAVKSDKALVQDVVVAQRKMTWAPLEERFGIQYTPLTDVLRSTSAATESRRVSSRTARSTARSRSGAVPCSG